MDFIPELLLICFTSATLFLVKNFLKHIDKDMITPLFLTKLEKVIIFVQKSHFLSLTGGFQLTLMTKLEKVIVFRHKQTFFVTNGGLQLTFMTQLEKVIIVHR